MPVRRGGGHSQHEWYNLLAGGMGGTSSFYHTFTISTPIYFTDTNYVLLRRRFLFGAIAPPPHAGILREKNRKREHKARLPYLHLWERGLNRLFVGIALLLVVLALNQTASTIDMFFLSLKLQF